MNMAYERIGYGRITTCHIVMVLSDAHTLTSMMISALSAKVFIGNTKMCLYLCILYHSSTLTRQGYCMLFMHQCVYRPPKMIIKLSISHICRHTYAVVFSSPSIPILQVGSTASFVISRLNPIRIKPYDVIAYNELINHTLTHIYIYEYMAL